MMKEWNESERMTDEEMKKLMERIEESAEDIRIPASLEPEAVKARLRSENARPHTYRGIPVRRLANAAAVLALVATLGGVGIYGKLPGDNGDLWDGGGQQAFAGSQLAMTDGRESEDEPETSYVRQKTPTVGSYHLAADYEEVYAALKKMDDNQLCFAEDFVVAEAAGVLDSAMRDDTEVFLEPSAVNGNAVQKGDTEEESKGSGDFSKTNTQVEGIDESDFIKNDGNYLYVQAKRLVRIVDIRGEQMKLVAELEAKIGANDNLREMYVDGDKLFLIVEKWEENRQSEYWWSWRNVSGVELQTYDISDRGAGKLLGTVQQDGGYHSSRKVGNYVYLFTQKSTYDYHIMPYYDDIAWEDDFSTERKSEEPQTMDYIPCINGEPIPADCIYLQDDASNELIVSSVDIRDPGNAVDNMVLLNNYANIYMSTNAIYLYSGRYEWDDGKIAGSDADSFTDIVKFSYWDGNLNGIGSASVKGTIQDVFAISEGNGVLRVLTTDWKWDGDGSENRLYLLDDNLRELGLLENIARGEEIYAARYIGNIAYFITYHNTDPLFAVDIADPTDPKMLGQLEISGFSDYLHPYGDGLLLGIGYETEPETSMRLGVKLVMFDISDPVNLKILDTVVLNGTYTSAADFYKSVLADSAKNLIGFEVSDWHSASDDALSYQLYTWQNGHFVRLLEEKISEKECWDMSMIRGLYAGNRFYTVNQWYNGHQIRSYDMNGQYRKLSELTFGEKTENTWWEDPVDWNVDVTDAVEPDETFGGEGEDDYLMNDGVVEEDLSVDDLWKMIKAGGSQAEDIGWDD